MRVRNPAVAATLYSPDTPQPGCELILGAEVAAHARVLRLEPGVSLCVTDGRGTRADAQLRRVERGRVAVEVFEVATVRREGELHAIVPIADKDRMLWLAEKAVELGVTSWRPVQWRRSRSVASRGEGAGFRKRLFARMTAALEQSGSAWLPDIFPESDVERAIAAAPQGARILLSPDGARCFPSVLHEPVVVAIGPEGGMEDDEISRFETAGFQRTVLAGNILRFETAAIAAFALARAALARQGGDGD